MIYNKEIENYITQMKYRKIAIEALCDDIGSDYTLNLEWNELNDEINKYIEQKKVS